MNQNKIGIRACLSLLVIISFLNVSFISPAYQAAPVLSMANVNQICPTLDDTTIDIIPIEVEKLVWNGVTWADTAVFDEGDTVDFFVSIFNPYDEYIIEFSGIIFDILPCNLEYQPLSSDISTIYPIEECEIINWEDNSVSWYKVTPIQPKDYLNFTYSAFAVCCGDGYEQNNLTVYPNRLVHVCDPSDIIENDGSLTVSDYASVKVICGEDPDISIEKKVNNSGCWMDSTSVFIGDTVQFQIHVTNTGLMNLTSVQVVDTLPSILQYNYDANITPHSASDNQIVWIIDSLDVGDSVEIMFSATALAAGEADNIVSVTSCQGATDSDHAHVVVAGMIVEKKIWDSISHQWLDTIDASVGDIVRFRITIYYIGNGLYNLYNIRVRDELPECLQYANNALPVQTAVSEDGKTIWWNLTTTIPSGGHMNIEFDTLVTETSGCGPCVNLANVTANECSGHIFYGEDTAMVIAECPLIVDIHGPYYGKVNQLVDIEASATGGTPPFVYTWDLDDDGYYDDHTGRTLSRSWSDSGTYPIHVKVTDSKSRTHTDSTVVIISPPTNQPPQIPTRPQGSSTGMAGVGYSYSTSSLDINNDLIRYGWDWNGDGTIDEWTGFYPSGISVTISHVWLTEGTYLIKVKAEDEQGLQSGFSESLSVVISENSAPMKPTLSGPTNGKIHMAYTYSAIGSDPDGDDLYFFFDWGDGTNSGWIGMYGSGQTASVTHTWTVAGSYPIKVKVKDVSGAESIWSDPLHVSMPKNQDYKGCSFSMILDWILFNFPFLSAFLHILYHTPIGLIR